MSSNLSIIVNSIIAEHPTSVLGSFLKSMDCIDFGSGENQSFLKNKYEELIKFNKDKEE
jgi:hypothetical protein